MLTGAFMALAAALAAGTTGRRSGGLLPDLPPVHSYTLVTGLLLSVCALLVTRAVLALAGRRPWDAAMIGLSPVLLVHAFTNWDLFAVALAGFGMLAWARRRLVLAGLLLGPPSRPSSTRSCSWAPCSCSVSGPGACGTGG